MGFAKRSQSALAESRYRLLNELRNRIAYNLNPLSRRAGADFRGAYFEQIHADPTAAPVLFRPRSESQRRGHTPPVVLRCSRSQPFSGDPLLHIGLSLWGGQAVEHQSAAVQAMERPGRRGLLDTRGRVSFDTCVRKTWTGRLADWLVRAGPGERCPQAVLVELEGAMDVAEVDIRKLVGNCAHDLVQWDLEDRSFAARLGKSGCDALADEARVEAEATLDAIRMTSSVLLPVDRGRRRSRSDAQRFPLRGVAGHVVLNGDLARALPWLLLLAERGAGRKKSFGLGQVHLWFPGR